MANEFRALSPLDFPHSVPSDEALLAAPAPMHRLVAFASLAEALAADASHILTLLYNNSVERDACAAELGCAEVPPLSSAAEQALLRFMANTFQLIEREANAVADAHLKA